MVKETNDEHPAIAEALDEIESALMDSRGLVPHQRRLAFCISSGAAILVERFLKKKGVLKSGVTVNHLWLKKSPANILKMLSEKMTSSPETVANLSAIIHKAHLLEHERDALAYGKDVDEKTLREKIALFLELKKEAEHA